MEKWLKTVQKVIVALLIADAAIWAALTLLPGQPLAAPGGEAEAQVYESVISSNSDAAGLFGNITVETEGRVSAAAACLLINGVPSGDFREGIVTARVYPGAVLAVDATAYQRPIAFYITAMSSGLDGDYLRAVVIARAEVAELGSVVFK